MSIDLGEKNSALLVLASVYCKYANLSRNCFLRWWWKKCKWNKSILFINFVSHLIVWNFKSVLRLHFRCEIQITFHLHTNSGVVMYPAGNDSQRNLNRNKKWKLDNRRVEGNMWEDAEWKMLKIWPCVNFKPNWELKRKNLQLLCISIELIYFDCQYSILFSFSILCLSAN